MTADLETRLDRALAREDRKRRGQCMHHNARGTRCRMTCHESSGIACKRHLPAMRLALATDLHEIDRMDAERDPSPVTDAGGLGGGYTEPMEAPPACAYCLDDGCSGAPCRHTSAPVVSDYASFLDSKKLSVPATSVPHGPLGAYLFSFQRAIVEWALERGRAAIFAECGLGKTIMELEWSRHVAAHAGPVLILAPLAVSQQTVREGARFGIDVRYARTQAEAGDAPIVITNYERFDAFDMSRFRGVVLDESSILKSYMGKVKRAIVERCAPVPFRLAGTATPAPNDHLELGNHAEFLGVMSSHEMIARWFLPDTSTFGKYRLKGHGIEPYWDWVASWAMCVTKPSDLGFSDAGYDLPELRQTPHVVSVDVTSDTDGELFRTPEMSATSVHREKRRTCDARSAEVARLIAAEPNEQWVVWCETDYEADALTAAIEGDGVLEVRGSQSVEAKERAVLDVLDGKVRVLVSKASIFGWGLNLQRVARVAFIGATFSYELFYQAIRRFWRFGQTRPVDVHVVMASTEASVWSVLTAKRDGHDEMRSQMSAAMRRARAKASPMAIYNPQIEMRVPAWLRSEA